MLCHGVRASSSVPVEAFLSTRTLRPLTLDPRQPERFAQTAVCARVLVCMRTYDCCMCIVHWIEQTNKNVKTLTDTDSPTHNHTRPHKITFIYTTVHTRTCRCVFLYLLVDMYTSTLPSCACLLLQHSL